jgi:hypothetical protein
MIRAEKVTVTVRSSEMSLHFLSITTFAFKCLRKFVHLAAEIQVPITKTHTYGFVEYGTDLGSSKDVRGNLTEFFQQTGHGASYGIGVKDCEGRICQGLSSIMSIDGI